MYNHFVDSKNVLISGCGGGYDVFAGLDLMFNLLELKKKVILASYSFTDPYLLRKYGQYVYDGCHKIESGIKIDKDDYINYQLDKKPIPPKNVCKLMATTQEDYRREVIDDDIYFPELKLVDFLKEKYDMDIPIYCFFDNGIKSMISAYNVIIYRHYIDSIVLVDGGTDSLMTGCEGGDALGTPYEDVCNIIAVKNSNCNNNYLYTLGYNIDSYCGVTDANFLQNTSNLIHQNYFIGSYMLNKNNISTQKYIETFMNCDPVNSIVNSLIVAAIEGRSRYDYPDYIKSRLTTNYHYINPLMSLYWIYDLNGVYNNLTYDCESLKDCEDGDEICEIMDI